ncbi:type I-E CRISPR-associated protein Cse1/CasA [Solwaraspora sp. WMMD791]|uniref:type I-E CRISPR-associated protein Cse1/CasA n=1 Tax=Solwaraspora sp. WMMD791 TaxID=3016086 RepID=UPI00249C2BAF|nr:type I-E CRISPR-associated protein Cse1/CasA [Solwaraspora sp. WMMD791]WFE28275.1 type I-E CRISPR-associated protein Cse1/CasA [Solwaraspora sp. WMMD791]
MRKPMSFDLVDQPWLLVQRLDGHVEEVSLVDAFRRAPELRRLAGELPTQEFAHLRLLLAVLHATLDGPDTSTWEQLWETPTLPVDDIADYLDEHRERFDLLHPTAPFYQVADLRTGKDEVFGLERLIADVPSGAQLLFTARSGPALHRISPAEAARWLVHAHAYDISGIKSGAAGDSRVKGGKVYPLGTGYTGSLGGVFVEGDNLRETLLLNLVPYNVPYLRSDDDDRPTWERDPLGPAAQDDLTPSGVMRLYTWQSRRIRLFGDADGITGVVLAYGDPLSPRDLHQREPMTAWRRSPTQEKALKTTPVYLPRTHTPDRALWRGLDAMLPGTAGRGRSGEPPANLDPGILEWTGYAANRGLLRRPVIRLRAVGAVYGTQQSVIDEVLDDAVTMPVRAVTDPHVAIEIQRAADAADRGVRALVALGRNLLRAAGVREDNRLDGAREATAAEAYAALDQQFRDWLRGLVDGVDLADSRTAWHRSAARTLRGIGDRMVAEAGPVAWAGRQIDNNLVTSAKADVWFRHQLSKALPLAGADQPAEPDTTDRPQEEVALT